MKALHVNLASRPYRDTRAFTVAVVALSAITLLLMINNIWTAVDYLSGTENVRAEIAALEAETAEIRKATTQNRERIESIDRQDVNRRIAYVNSQIAERAFSWSALLDDLERVLPDDVRITQLNPTIGPEGVQLTLALEAKEQEGIIEFLDRMLADPSFTRAFPLREQVEENGIRTFTVQSEYRGQGVVNLDGMVAR